MLEGYGLSSNTLTLLFDNSSAIDISENLVQHSWTKHIDIKHHFNRDSFEKNLVCISHTSTEYQLADICTKALNFKRFSNIRKSLDMCML